MKTMPFFFGIFFLFFSCGLLSSFALEVRIIGENNKRGIARDIVILKEALLHLGHTVETFDYNQREKVNKKPLKIVDIQILIQNVSDPLLSFGRRNYFIPNPEITPCSMSELKKVHLILARTREAERIFTELGFPVFFLGFASKDHMLPGIEKDFQSFLHVKGFSVYKSTQEIVRAWGKFFPELILIDHNREYPKLPSNMHLIQKYLSEEELQFLQNSVGIHLCPSQTEGFGHYLIEAMSVGAVVITTDAPPMNEYITDPQFLIPYSTTYSQNYATLYHVTPEAIRNKIEEVLHMNLKQLKEAAEANRKKYVEMRSSFLKNLRHLLSR